MRIPAQTLYCQELQSLNYMTAAIVCIYFYAIVYEIQETMFKRSVKAQPHCPLTSSFYRTQRISAQTLYRQKPDSLPKICADDSMRLSLLVLMQLFFEIARSKPAKPA